jgi:DnaJ family protein C protein 19
MIAKLLVALAIAYLGWRMWHGFGNAPTVKRGAVAVIDPVDAATARRVLGVDRTADAPTIRAAHRRLMAEAHPDRGGSDAEARALNAARDLLLGRSG